MLIRTVGSAIALWTIALGASAQMLTLPPRTTGLTPIKGQITTVQSARIPLGDAITGSETRVTLKFKLQGCLDKLMPLISYAETQDNRATFYITALNAHSADSRVANCRAMPQTTAQVRVPGLFQRDQIRVVFLGVPQ